jgi:hypothetical protein
MWSSSFFLGDIMWGVHSEPVPRGLHHGRPSLSVAAVAAVAAGLAASRLRRNARTGPSGALAPPPVGQAGEKSIQVIDVLIIKYYILYIYI